MVLEYIVGMTNLNAHITAKFNRTVDLDVVEEYDANTATSEVLNERFKAGEEVSFVVTALGEDPVTKKADENVWDIQLDDGTSILGVDARIFDVVKSS